MHREEGSTITEEEKEDTGEDIQTALEVTINKMVLEEDFIRIIIEGNHIIKEVEEDIK